MRIWFSGPRLFGGLIRPGVSFGPGDFGRRSADPFAQQQIGGYCYVIRGDHGYVKLGSSVQPIRRLGELQTGSPFRLEIVNTVAVSHNAEEIERTAHELLDRHRLHGEWFAVTPEIATAAIYAAADRVGRSIIGEEAPKRREPIATPLGWIGIFLLLSYAWHYFTK